MDLPRPTTSVGTRIDYSVGPWDYTACATRHLMVWSTRTTEEKYSVRKLYMSRTVWKTPRSTRLGSYRRLNWRQVSDRGFVAISANVESD
jgi:hypothetical protein